MKLPHQTPQKTFRKVPRTASPILVIALCTSLVICEGYDLIVYGAIVPKLLAHPGWHLNTATIGLVGSLVYVGMLIGALSSGPMADRIGRRNVILSSLIWITLATAACAVSATVWQLSVARLAVGIGMGAVMPGAVALCREFVPANRVGLTMTVLMAGVPIGGTLAALVAIPVLPHFGWRPMFGLGVLMGLTVLAIAWRKLPESPEFLARKAASGDGRALAVTENKGGYRALLSSRFRTAAILCALIVFANLISWYGLNTWITQLMRELNYPLTSALQFSLVLNIGAIAGSFILAYFADRWSISGVAVIASSTAAAAVVLLAHGSTSTAFLMVLVALAGTGGHTVLNLMNAWVASYFPTELRGTAIGWSNGMGRPGAILTPSLGGWILTAGLGAHSVFYAFAISSVICALLLVALTVVTRGPAPSHHEPSTSKTSSTSCDAASLTTSTQGQKSI